MRHQTISLKLDHQKLTAFIILAVVIFSVQSVFALAEDTTTIVVVGTVHNKTEKFTAQKLYGIMERVKPDLILVELDSSFFTPSMSIKPEDLNASLENSVVADYQKASGVPIRPYDIEGRNKIYQDHKYFKLQKDLSKALNQADQDSLLRGESALLLDAIDRFDGIGRAFGTESPEVINSNICDVAMESKQYYGGDGMLRIVSSVPVLKQFTEFATFKRDFWITRNEAMVANIRSWAKSLHPKTILVLCGFEHMYFLRDKLKSDTTSGTFILREYWTF
jgi:hypothetical protein